MHDGFIGLPLKTPHITTYPANTANLAVASLHPDFSKWLYNTNVQLMISKDIATSGGRYSMLEFFPFDCPLINRIHIPDVLLDKCSSITDKLISYLSNAFCIMLEIDLYYIPQSDCYKQYHGWQPVLIFGYDSKESTFSIAGFFEHAKYQFINVSADILAHAFDCLSIVDEERLEPSKCSICIISVRDEYTYQFRVESLKEVIADYRDSIEPKGYLFSELLNIRDVSDFTFGLSVYEMIEEYIKNIMQYQWQCDLRLVHVLYQHKVLWLERVKYLQDEMLLSSDIGAEAFKSVEKLVCQAGTLRSLAIKYEVTNSIKILGKMVQLLPQIKMLDKTLCDKMLAAL